MSLSHSPTFRLAEPDDLRLLWTQARHGRRLVTGRIAVDLPGLPEDEREGYERRINKAYFDCGCVEAAIIGFAGLAAYIFWANGEAETSLWLKLAGGALVFFVATGLGKLLGRHRASAALRREVEKLGRASRISLGRENPTGGASCAVGEAGDAAANELRSQGRTS